MVVVTPEARSVAVHQLIPDMLELLRNGVPEQLLPDLIEDRYEAICQQVANGPVDLRIEQWIHDRFLGLRPVQAR